jgi:type VI secretion system secreted protein VgrG
LLLFSLSALTLNAGPILGSASSFAVLGASTVTSTGLTVLWGNLGVGPGTSITGFPPGVVHGTIYDGDAVADQAEADALTAYNTLVKLPSDYNLTGEDLGGLTLLPGVYTFNSSAQLTGQLLLNMEGDCNARFVFVIGSTLTTASGASVITTNGTSCGNVYWVLGSSATIGSTTNFLGNILADASIALNTGANIADGSALALTGAVTLDDNEISLGLSAVPEPGTVALVGAGLFGLALLRRTSRKRAA